MGNNTDIWYIAVQFTTIIIFDQLFSRRHGSYKKKWTTKKDELTKVVFGKNFTSYNTIFFY